MAVGGSEGGSPAGEFGLVLAGAVGVAAANEGLSRIEQVKRFALLPAEWTPRRRVVGSGGFVHRKLFASS